jgi:HlyD family secretion protein
MKKLISLIVIATGVSFFVLSKNTSSSTTNPVFSTYKVQEQTVNDSILASGSFAFTNEIALRSEVMGKVTRLYVQEGDMVAKGDILLELDKAAFIADVEQAKASVSIQVAEIKKLQELKNETVRRNAQLEVLSAQRVIDADTMAKSHSDVRIADINLESAQHKLSQLSAVLAQREDALSKTVFVAPIDGLVLNLDVKEGETVIAGTTNIVGSALLTLADIDTYVAHLRVDEADLGNISIGQSVDVYPAAMPTKPLTGAIISVGTMAKQQSVNQGLFYKVQVKLNAPKNLFPGMSCRAEVLVSKHEHALSVPIAAIQSSNGEPYLWVTQGNKVEKRAVRLGLTSDTEQVIIAGLQNNETVLTGPSRELEQLKQGASVLVQGG